MSSGLSLKEIDNPYGNISKFSGFNFNISPAIIWPNSCNVQNINIVKYTLIWFVNKNNDFQINSYSHNIPPGKITLSFKHIQVTQNYAN